MPHTILSLNESITVDSLLQLQHIGGNGGAPCDTLHTILPMLFERVYKSPNIDINTLAGAMNVSRRWLYEQTIRIIEKTPSQHLNDLRMQAACPLLQSGKSLIEVSKEVGYANTKTFSEAFKRHFGMSPGRWAKENPPPVTIAPTCSNST